MKNNQNFLIKDFEIYKNECGLSEEKFLKSIGVSRMTYYRWANDICMPNKNIIENIYTNIYIKGIDLNVIKENSYLSKKVKDKTILFHGSHEGIEGKLSIKHSNKNNDFGKGFYLVENLKQSMNFILENERPKIYIIEIDNLSKINKIKFNICLQWVILSAYFRGKLNEYKNSNYLKKVLKKIEKKDLIISPVSDPSVYKVIDDFIDGEITDQQCINTISAKDLNLQYVFLNDKILGTNVHIIDEGYVSLPEKKYYISSKERDDQIARYKMLTTKRLSAGKGLYIEEIMK